MALIRESAGSASMDGGLSIRNLFLTIGFYKLSRRASAQVV